MSRMKFCGDADSIYYSKLSTNFRKIIPSLEKELDEKNKSIFITSDKIAKLEESVKLLNCENLELKRNLSVSDEEKKRLELKCLNFSKLISSFEKIVVNERGNFEEKKTVFETKSMELSCKISELQKILEKERKESDFERKESEQLKVQRFQDLSQKDDFERERRIFKTEISKLTKRLSNLSTEIMLEKRCKFNLQKTLEVNLRKKNILAKRIKEFDFAHSNHSLKTTSNSRNNVLKGSFKPNMFSKIQTSTSKFFHDHRLDKLVNQAFKKVKKVWIVKGSIPVQNVQNDKKPFISGMYDKCIKAFHTIGPIRIWVPKTSVSIT